MLKVFRLLSAQMMQSGLVEPYRLVKREYQKWAADTEPPFKENDGGMLDRKQG